MKKLLLIFVALICSSSVYGSAANRKQRFDENQCNVKSSASSSSSSASAAKFAAQQRMETPTTSEKRYGVASTILGLLYELNGIMELQDTSNFKPWSIGCQVTLCSGEDQVCSHMNQVNVTFNVSGPYFSLNHCVRIMNENAFLDEIRSYKSELESCEIGNIKIIFYDNSGFQDDKRTHKMHANLKPIFEARIDDLFKPELKKDKNESF